MDPTGPHWSCKEKHVFIFSIAGKPIYSRHGDEDKLASLFGVMQVGIAPRGAHTTRTATTLHSFLLHNLYMVGSTSLTLVVTFGVSMLRCFGGHLSLPTFPGAGFIRARGR